MMMIASNIGSPIDRPKINARSVPPPVDGQTLWEFEATTEMVATSKLLT